MAGHTHLDIFFDFLCPFVYRAATWLDRVWEGSDNELSIRWRYYSLEQANSQEGPGWKLWEQPDDYPSRGLWAFRAAEAARCQGKDAFNRFHSTLLRARHQQGKDLSDRNVLAEVASGVGLDMPRFQEDLKRRELLSSLAEDHRTAVEEFGVFGTPTVVFPGGRAVFIKLTEVPPAGDALALFHELMQISTVRTYVLEIKRPQRPKKG
ncbi:MAG: DsbA family protein [Dehalococcoidia bacterium]|jgi:predicted DsbA family dithiol-disulfide isomerase|nr:DsbA family protein [Dehalococcoidia bacterium]MDP7240244.1 DsbA family protein [Dehalococcoidia bacterium]